jgi:transposase
MRPKGSAEALEVRRLMAGRLLLEGKGVREVCRLTGAVPSSVSCWKKELERGGLEALKGKPHPGRPARLTPCQKQALEEILLTGARAAGFSTDLWTLARVTQVIEREFGVQYHAGHVWYILRGVGWSRQKPERRARERDEAAIARWRKEEWSQVKKSSRQWLEHRPDRRKRLYAAAGGSSDLGTQG